MCISDDHDDNLTKLGCVAVRVDQGDTIHLEFMFGMIPLPPVPFTTCTTFYARKIVTKICVFHTYTPSVRVCICLVSVTLLTMALIDTEGLELLVKVKNTTKKTEKLEQLVYTFEEKFQKLEEEEQMV